MGFSLLCVLVVILLKILSLTATYIDTICSMLMVLVAGHIFKNRNVAKKSNKKYG
jgi:hypothetical protein